MVGERDEEATRKILGEYFRELSKVDDYLNDKAIGFSYRRGCPSLRKGPLVESGEGKLPTKILREKTIIIDDVPRSAVMRKESTYLLSCRNPFRVDPDMINYELDSEEEWAEQNGEDLNEDQNADDEEEGESEQDEHAGFIVEDDYLSASELNYSQCSDREMSQELLHADLKRRR